jgi:hypothetical protein
MMKIHYDPYTLPDECPDEKAICGTTLGDECSVIDDWKNVTCKRCLKMRANKVTVVEKEKGSAK